MAEKFRFEKATGDGGAIDFDESAITARTEVVDGAREKLLAGAGFAEEKDGRARGSGKLHLGKSALEHGALANNFLEIKLAANFFLEVEFFDGQLVLERVDFLERQGVFHRDGDLRPTCWRSSTSRGKA